jgi:hypothetical protein
MQDHEPWHLSSGTIRKNHARWQNLWVPCHERSMSVRLHQVGRTNSTEHRMCVAHYRLISISNICNIPHLTGKYSMALYKSNPKYKTTTNTLLSELP